jgi:hypothetical protein
LCGIELSVETAPSLSQMMTLKAQDSQIVSAVIRGVAIHMVNLHALAGLATNAASSVGLKKHLRGCFLWNLSSVSWCHPNVNPPS